MKVDLSQFVGVNTGKNENPRRNDAIAKGDVSKAHGQAIKRRAEKNTPWAPFAYGSETASK